MLEALQSWDESVFLAINGGLSSQLLDGVMRAMSELGEGLPVALILLACAFIGEKSGVRGRIVFMLVGVLAGSVLVHVVKLVGSRPRPGGAFEARIKTGEVKVNLVGAPPRGKTSFPSGHAQGAFSSAIVLGELFRRLRWPLIAVATMIALSRIYVGAHFPIDVLVGSLLGVVGGLIAIYLRRRQLARAPALVQGAAQ